MMLLRHLPTRRIVSVSTRAMRKAMAPPGRIDRTLTSSGVNPTWGPMRVVAARSAAVISALRTVYHVVPFKMAARSVSGMASYCRRCATRRRMAATAHARGCPVLPCPLDSHLMPFLCVVKRRLKKGGGAGGIRSRGGAGGLIKHKELYVAQVERGSDGVGTAGAVFPGSKKEEESDPGEVCDSLVSWGATFGD